MGTTVSSASSPEPDDSASVAERVVLYLEQKPLRLHNMLKVTKLINDSSPDEKLHLHERRVLVLLCDLIAECGSFQKQPIAQPPADNDRRRRRRNSGQTQGIGLTAQKGVGYGHGSTRSRWDIERAVEERLAREEHLIWVLNALTAFVFCASPDFHDTDFIQLNDAAFSHMTPQVVKVITDSAIVALLEYHLNNDSVFDVSEHMELYQALLETAAAMSCVPELVPYLVRPPRPDSKSVAKELVPRFRDIMDSYPNAFKGHMGSPDFRLVDFIRRIDRYSEVIIAAARQYESNLPSEQRIRTAVARQRVPNSESSLSRISDEESASLDGVDVGLLYAKLLKSYQVASHRFIGDYGKLVIPFTFKKEVRNINPFSPSLKERTKRIAKELASMPNTLPLNASNSIFVCVDEGRCDIIKVLISGPDDTPYQNGLFEFDVFFPNTYPFSPPKCAFLTTGAGNVRFNPNLYSDGKICLSILGTWEGRPEEKWNPYCSLLQVLISIQGLIFVKEPYFNEPGFEKYQGTEKGEDYSRRYNMQIEHATLSYAIRDQLRNGPDHFKEVIHRHFWIKRKAIIEQAQRWLAEMRKDFAESEKNSKRKDSINFETIYQPQQQERTIQALIDELNALPCPVDHAKIDEEGKEASLEV